ncbi:unnamed protein product, partial [marine sediment metagenome]
MILNNGFLVRLKKKNGTNFYKLGLCLFFIFIFTITSFYFDYNNKQGNNYSAENFSQKLDNTDITNLNIAAGPEIFVDPFTFNFSKIWNFF